MAQNDRIDIFSGFDAKAGMGEYRGPDAAPSWVGADDKRRLNFYARARAYVETVARRFLIEDDDRPDRVDEWREFGDAALLVEQRATSILGDGVLVGVIGAGDPLPDAPDIPPAPRPPAGTLEGVEAEIAAEVFDDSMAVWEVAARGELARWRALVAERPALLRRQDYLRDWADAVDLVGLMLENETENIVPLGSGIYVLGWDAERARVGIEIYEPDAYFPVLDDARPGEYPNRVHLAWQYTDDGKDYVRRITYELVRISGGEEGDTVDGETVFADLAGARPLYLDPGDRWTHSCLLTDATWPLSAFSDVSRLFADGAVYRNEMVGDTTVELRRYPIGLDFIPIVHFPNTLARTTHFGRSTLARLSQLLDELAESDADESLATRWAARPPIALSGMSPGAESIDLTPGRGVRLGDGGSLSTIDMAANLEQIGSRIRALLKRLSVNARTPEGILGRVDAAEVPSGLALALSFTPFEQSTETARLARSGKATLLLKMVQRIAIANADPLLDGDDSTVVYPAEVRWGTYMPQDLSGIATTLTGLFNAHLVSQQTAIRALQDAGLPVEDAVAELAAIRELMVDVADGLTGSLEDPRYAAEFLGIVDYGVEDGVDVDAGAVVVPPAAAF